MSTRAAHEGVRLVEVSIPYRERVGCGLKKDLASRMANALIDEQQAAARRSGAPGGRTCRAGGDGLLLPNCPAKRQPPARGALRGRGQLPFRLERDGDKVILDYRC